METSFPRVKKRDRKKNGYCNINDYDKRIHKFNNLFIYITSNPKL